jgi:hypothetical protein
MNLGSTPRLNPDRGPALGANLPVDIRSVTTAFGLWRRRGRKLASIVDDLHVLLLVERLRESQVITGVISRHNEEDRTMVGCLRRSVEIPGPGVVLLQEPMDDIPFVVSWEGTAGEVSSIGATPAWTTLRASSGRRTSRERPDGLPKTDQIM